MSKYSTELVIGMDVSKKSIEIYLLNTSTKEGKLESVVNDIRVLNEYFNQFENPKGTVIAMECGVDSPWMNLLLESKGFKVYVGNARKLHMIWQDNNKCDGRDAEMLARIAHFDPKLLSPIKHRELAQRLDLAIVKSRDVLVRTKTTIMNSIRGQLRSFGIKTSSLKPYNFSKCAYALLPKELMEPLKGLVDQVAHLDNEIRKYDKKINRLCKKYPETDHLNQVHGVGPLIAITFVLVIGTPKRFSNGRKLSSYLGLVPKRAQSGSCDPQLGITRAGNPLLRRLLVQAANYNLGPFGKESDLRDFGERISARGGSIARKKAKIAVARKIAILLLKLWETGDEYHLHNKTTKNKAA